MTVRRAFLSPLWLLFSLPGYIGWRLLPPLAIGPVGVLAGITLLIVCCVVIPLSVRQRTLRDPTLQNLFAWTGLLFMGFFSSLFVFTLLRDVVLLFVRLLVSAQQAAAFAAPSARWTLVLSVFVTLAGLVIARRRPHVVHVDIPVSNLPEALHGFSIVQISDVHVGPTIKRSFVEKIVSSVNGLKADLIAVTGDLVDGSVQQLSAHTAPWCNKEVALPGVRFHTTIRNPDWRRREAMPWPILPRPNTAIICMRAKLVYSFRLLFILGLDAEGGSST